MKNIISKMVILAACAVGASPALASGEESSLTIYSGYFNADKGFSDRFVVGSFGNFYSGKTGLHSDIVYVDREQNAAFAALGISQALSDFARVKVMAGSSTRNDSILPRAFLQAMVELKPGHGLLVSPGIIYRSYRSGGHEVAPSVQMAKYFTVPSDTGGYYVAQADGGLSFNNSHHTGWSGGAGLTTVRRSGMTFGINGRAGHSAYDSAFGTGVRSNFYGGGATVGYRFKSRHEVFVRADVTHSTLYTVSGAMVGFKVPL